MMNRLTGSAAAFLWLALLVSGAHGEGAAAPPMADLAIPSPAAVVPDAGPAAHEPTVIESPIGSAVRARLGASPLGGSSEYEAKEWGALAAFYDARRGLPLWVSEAGLNEQAKAAIAAIGRADEWGLSAADFVLPKTAGSDPAALAESELKLTLAMLKYARHARGGRIMDPPTQLSSYLDRKPQLIEPSEILASLAAAADPGVYLEGLHPKHPQFELLRQKYLALRGSAAKPKSASGSGSRGSPGHEVRRILANMEEWRWMPADMGKFYVWNNIPEYLTRVVKDGEIVHTERIVAGLISKQTPIFSRPMRRIVFRPKWRVPESIMVRELWPSMLKGGGLMHQFGLQLETKEGQPLDWRKMDWTKEDIRNYIVVQPPGPKNLLGLVKFAFPSQHTVYMHDTPDKYLFAASQRTASHGCMRVRNPIELAKVLLGEDKGWDGAHIDELVKNGPLDNQIELEHRIPVHITYFTAFVASEGQLITVPDVYGHERRITLALEGKWNQIVVGRNHLDPVDPNSVVRANAQVAAAKAEAKSKSYVNSGGGLFGAIFGGGL